MHRAIALKVHEYPQLYNKAWRITSLSPISVRNLNSLTLSKEFGKLMNHDNSCRTLDIDLCKTSDMQKQSTSRKSRFFPVVKADNLCQRRFPLNLDFCVKIIRIFNWSVGILESGGGKLFTRFIHSKIIFYTMTRNYTKVTLRWTEMKLTYEKSKQLRSSV